MIMRSGFVANSSTSSFVCVICGASETVFDSVSLADIGMCQCENEHLICMDHLHDTDTYTDEGEIDSSICPICQLQTYSTEEMADYLKEKKGVSREEVFAEIKKQNKRRRVLRNSEYITYVFTKFGITEDSIMEEIRTKYGTYENFIERKEK